MGHMLIEFFSKSMAVYLMYFVTFLSLFIKAMAGRRCAKLMHQSGDLVLAGDKSLKQLRVRYESAYRINKGNVKADSMVNSFMRGYHFLGLPLRSFERAHYMAALFCTLMAVAGFGVMFTHDCTLVDCSRIFFWGAGLALTNILVGMALSVHNSEGVRLSLTDYLDNTLAARIGMENEQREKQSVRSGMRDDIFMKKEESETGLELYKDPAAGIAATIEKEPEPRMSGEKRGRRLSERDEQIIADVLKEYLGGKY